MHAVLALLLAAAAPLADDKAFQEGLDLYGRFEFEQATFRFESAAVEKDRAPQERARVFVWLGLSYAAIGRFDDAERSFVDALRLDPAAAIETEVSPKVAEVFAKAKQVAAPRVEEPPPPPPPPPPVVDAAPPLLLIGGGAAAGTGLVALAAAGVLVALYVGNAEIVRDPDAFQDVAKRAQDDANAQIVGAGVLGGVGGLLVGGGAALVALDLLSE